MDSLAVLSAGYLARNGAFDEKFRLAPGAGDRPRGWDWTGQMPKDFTLGQSATVIVGRNGTPAVNVDRSAWLRDGKPEPYVYSAPSSPTEMRIAGRGDFWRRVPHRVFVELPAFDPDLGQVPADADFLLTMGRIRERGLVLPNGLAAKYGRETWSTDTVPKWVQPRGTSDPFMLTLFAREHEDAWGNWLRVDPVTARAAVAAGEGVAARWSRELAFRTFGGPDRRPSVVAAMDYTAMSGPERWRRSVRDTLLTGLSWSVLMRFGRKVRAADLRQVPWVEFDLPSPVYLDIHGVRGGTILPTSSGTRTTSGAESVAWMSAAIDQLGRSRRHPIVAQNCFGASGRERHRPQMSGSVYGREARGTDPLADMSELELLADGRGQTVFALPGEGYLGVGSEVPQLGLHPQQPVLGSGTDPRGKG